MESANQFFQEVLIKIIRASNEINTNIITKKVTSIIDVKKHFLVFKKIIDAQVPKDLMISYEGKPINCYDELNSELEKFYSISLNFFRSQNWGIFSKLTPKKFPELYDMMIDKNGDLLRTYDDFKGTVAVMDFHGYTKFSNEIKYNKTPLLEFGTILPQKIEAICTLCKCIVYESEGDALIMIGPENPVYIFNAVLSIIELARQKALNPKCNPKDFHNIEIFNPMIKPFEMNAAITTGGETFINSNGDIIGTIISEASRILKIINTKMPEKSGIIVSEKVYRKLDKNKETQTGCHLTVFDFKTSFPFLVDVKGMRLNIREIYIEEREYLPFVKLYTNDLIEEMKKKTPSKLFNIFVLYLRLLISALTRIKCIVQISGEELNQDKIKFILEARLKEWNESCSSETIRNVLKIASVLYNSVNEIKDVTAIFHDYIQENFFYIAEKLDAFFLEAIKREETNTPSLKKAMENYNSEMKRARSRLIPRRVLETVLLDTNLNKQLMDVPYMGKK
jgi:hypothetical protein